MHPKEQSELKKKLKKNKKDDLIQKKSFTMSKYPQSKGYIEAIKKVDDYLGKSLGKKVVIPFIYCKYVWEMI